MRQIAFILFIFTTVLFAQTNDKDSSNRDCSYFSMSNSIRTTSFVYNNKRAVNSLKVGAYGTGIGAVIGLGTAYLLTNGSCTDLCPLNYIVLPMLGAGLGFLTGTTVGYFINDDYSEQIVNYPFQHRPLLALGVSSSFSAFISKNISYEEYAFGIAYRNMCKEYYIPNRIILLLKQTLPYGSYNYRDALIYDDTLPMQFIETKFGLNTVYIQHENVLGFIYGLEFGLTSIKHFENTVLGECDAKENKMLPYLDTIIGLNLNVASYLSFEFFYYYELFGSYQGLKDQNDNLLGYSQQVGINLLIYLK